MDNGRKEGPHARLLPEVRGHLRGLREHAGPLLRVRDTAGHREAAEAEEEAEVTLETSKRPRGAKGGIGVLAGGAGGG